LVAGAAGIAHIADQETLFIQQVYRFTPIR
jgi:hypothetical protein